VPVTSDAVSSTVLIYGLRLDGEGWRKRFPAGNHPVSILTVLRSG
jgi:hypothetical protein